MMKRFFWITAIIALSLQAAFAQPDWQQFYREMENAPSIHQTEWQNYRDYQPHGETPEFHGKPMPLVPRQRALSREVFGYLPYWVYNSYPSLNYDLLSTIAYFGVDVDGYGNIVNQHHWPAAGLVNTAHSHGVRVVLTVILFDGTQLNTLLGNPTYRTNLINNLVLHVQYANADGVNIDFEGIPSGNRQNLTDFMTELANTFHSQIPGSYVTIFTPAVDWRNNYDYYQLAQVTDGLVIQGYDYHWSSGPTAGPTAPLTSGSVWGYWNITRSVEDYITKTQNNVSKLILSVPFYGFEWPTANGGLASPTLGTGTAIFYSTAYSNALQYGRLWDTNSQTPWYKYNDGNWNQGWYDDSLSLALKFDLVNQKNLKGIAIWALSYDGQRQELQAAIANAFGSSAPPLKPVNFRVTNVGNGAVKVAVNSAVGATSYRLYQSTDGTNFTAVMDFPSPEVTLSNLSQDSVYYFKVTALNGNGESSATEVLGVKPTTETVRILIVNGFDRTSGTVNTFDFIKRYAPSVVKTGYAFDACSNEAVQDNQISLNHYRVVIWILGEEGTADESFNSVEQTLVAGYLENGGRLFVSGSEIGYDLVQKGSTADKQFYRTYLKASYVMDRVPTYTTDGDPAGIFHGLSSMHFDNGTHGTYNVDYPDGIQPIDGSSQCLVYSGFPASTYGGAGIQYAGIFGQGVHPGKIVYLAVPFETFYPASVRDTIMARVIEYFDIPSAIQTEDEMPLAEDFRLFPNYPNPFNPRTHIDFEIKGLRKRMVQLTVYNTLGELVKTLLHQPLSAGKYSLVWDGTNEQGQSVASGVYIYRLQVGNRVVSRKMTLLK